MPSQKHKPPSTDFFFFFVSQNLFYEKEEMKGNTHFIFLFLFDEAQRSMYRAIWQSRRRQQNKLGVGEGKGPAGALEADPAHAKAREINKR
jgi:hypothetical protein